MSHKAVAAATQSHHRGCYVNLGNARKTSLLRGAERQQPGVLSGSAGDGM